MTDTLILNADGMPMSLMPLSTKPWWEIINDTLEDKVDVIYEYDDWEVHSPSVSIPVPSVVMLRKYVRVAKQVAFNRENLLIRDNYTCQYCGENFRHNQSALTMEHVLPRVYGGKTTWTNIVAACSPCNNGRGHSLTHKRPANEPYRPTYWDMVSSIKKMPLVIPDEKWLPMLQWDGEVRVNPNIRTKGKTH